MNVYRKTDFKYPKIVRSTTTGGRQVNLQGCYVDGNTATTRLLTKHTWTSGTEMTVDACATRCSTRGYAVFGVEYGNECYCGTAVPSDTLLAASEYECREKFCSGDPKTFCGAGKRILIYA